MHRPDEDDLDAEPAGPEWLDADADVIEHHAPPHRARVDPTDTRPEIILSGELHDVVEECVAALAGARANGGDPNLFQRANELVTVARYVPDRSLAERGARLEPGHPAVYPIDEHVLAMRLSRFARLMRRAKPTAKERAMAEMGHVPPPRYEPVQRAPQHILSAILRIREWPAIRPLTGVSETPILRPDGTIASAHGSRPTYDWMTGYLIIPSIHVDVPLEPTQDDARRALDDLLEPFCDFPYRDESSRMVPVAAILTILARPAIRGSVPMFVFDAATRGSGKTKQADLVSRIALGRGAARAPMPEDDVEVEKLLAGYAISGTPLILLDNVTRQLGGGRLDACITADDDVELRVLGRTEVRRLPWRAVIMASGNNVAIADDTSRRVLVSRLESPLEDPETRTGFRISDVIGWTMRERQRLVTAALTILRSYTYHGCPDAGLGTWGSFEQWARLIPGAIAFAGGGDVMGARPRGDAAMTDEMASIAIVIRDLPRISDTPLSSREIIALLWPGGRAPEGHDGWDDLRAAIETIAPGRGGPPSPRALGERLRRAVGRVIGGRRLEPIMTHGHVRRWTVVAV